MSPASVVFYMDKDGVPARDWIIDQTKEIQDKIYVRIEYLQKEGHMAKEPGAKWLEENLYELRVKVQRIHYRILYAFCGKGEAVLLHGCTKESNIPPKDMAIARARRDRHASNKSKYTYAPDVT